ncbi:MAG: hypothetical protein ACE5RF_09230 [Nitrosarchaeum sp.]
MKNIEEKTKKNFDWKALVPFVGMKGRSWSNSEVLLSVASSIVAQVTIPFYAAFAIGYGPNPGKWAEGIHADAIRRDSVENVSQMQKEEFPSYLYQEISGEDGVIDSTEFANFYKKADSVNGIYYPKLSEFYSREK